MEDLNNYIDRICLAILYSFSKREIEMAGLDKNEIHKMITDHENEYRERELNYPNHFDQSIEDMWENDQSDKEALDYFLPGVKTLVIGQLSVM